MYKKQLLENYIRKIVKQTIRESIFEADKNNDSDSDSLSNKSIASMRKTVQSILDRESCKHTPYATFLYPDLDVQSATSLFAKKYKHEPYPDGNGYYSFDNDEITKLYNRMSSEQQKVD